MTENDLLICERFKEVRSALKKKQGDFAREIRTTQGHVSDIENKRKPVSDRIIEIIRLKYNVSEKWLRTGTGKMFRERSPSDEVGYYVEEILEYDGHGNPFYDMIIEMMKTYVELDEKSQTVIRDYFKKVSDGIHKETQEN